MKQLLQRYIGTRWGPKPVPKNLNWFNILELVHYMNSQICPTTKNGVIGALSQLTNGNRLSRGLSVGCGDGAKEIALLRAGLVDQFDLFELSETYAAAARQAAASEQLNERVEVIVGDAFSQVRKEKYDLVYWDHSLHHMMNVDKAIEWSIGALAPGGWLIVNDYVGPTRLVWRREEVELARQFLNANRSELGFSPKVLRHKHLGDRMKLFLRDPSEAPQSDKIMASFESRCQKKMRPLGGVMIHLCAPFLPREPEQNRQMCKKLIAWDREALADGKTHFAFGAWQKPSAR